MDSESVHVFTYGTLQTRASNFAAIIKNNARSIKPATLEGILVMKKEEDESYPWLIQDSRTLQSIDEKFGIEPMTIWGEIVQFDNLQPLKELDEIENYDQHYVGVEQHELPHPFVNAYLRRELKARIRPSGNQEQEEIVPCFAYIYNPSNKYAQKILDRKKKGSLIIVPGGNWKDYIKERPNRTLNQLNQHFSSIGMETEIQVEVGGSPLPVLRKHRKFHFKDDEGKELRPDTLKKFLSQAFFYILKNDDLGRGTLFKFYEKDPEVNSRFPIPFGFAYVDGELIQENGEAVPIKPIFNRGLSQEGNLYRQAKERPRLIPQEHFFEIAGMPIRVQAGFARKQVEQELIRRWYLSRTLDCLKFVKVDGKWNDNIEQKFNSTQYNFILNPHIDNIDLSPTEIQLTKHTDGTEKRKKYLCDIADVLGRTYGPLISFFLSGSVGPINYNPRSQNRLEFRSTPVSDPQQLEAGLYVFLASVQTVESKAKDYLRDRVSRELKQNLEDISARDFRRVFATITPEDYLNTFETYIPSLEYAFGSLRPGYCLDEDTSYQRCIKDPDMSILSVHTRDEDKEIVFMELIKALFYDEVFQEQLKQMVSTREYESIEGFVDGDKIIEASTAPHLMIDPEQLETTIHDYIGKSPLDYLNGTGTYPELVTNMLLCSKGEYTFSDETHSLGIRIPLEAKNELYIGNVPLEISLYKYSSEPSDADLQPVDSFETNLSLTNFPQLLSAINNQKKGTTPVWETYYQLK